MWGAKSGVEQLPPFPEPSHNVVHRSHNVPDYAKACVVDFQTAEAEANALPLVRVCRLIPCSSKTVSMQACTSLCWW